MLWESGKFLKAVVGAGAGDASATRFGGGTGPLREGRTIPRPICVHRPRAHDPAGGAASRWLLRAHRNTRADQSPHQVSALILCIVYGAEQAKIPSKLELGHCTRVAVIGAHNHTDIHIMSPSRSTSLTTRSVPQTLCSCHHHCCCYCRLVCDVVDDACKLPALISADRCSNCEMHSLCCRKWYV